jgi:hypothetical protein
MEKEKQFLYWCMECSSFVEPKHRCEQWAQIKAIPVEAIDEYNDPMIGFLKAEIERKNEALKKASLIIERHQTWTGQGWKQDHVPNFEAKKIHAILEEPIQEED